MNLTIWTISTDIEIKEIIMKQPKPVAVFDSGLGGISVLQELIRLMPQENYLYFGDSLNAPYGIKSTDEVLALTLKNIDFLLSRQA